jgi:hypothetical protein
MAILFYDIVTNGRIHTIVWGIVQLENLKCYCDYSACIINYQNSNSRKQINFNFKNL